MANDSIDENVTQIDGRVNRAEKLLEHLIAGKGTYHNHKETMAHAGLLVMLALCGSILSVSVWPPEWVPGLSLQLSPQWITFIGFFVLWCLLHVYIRWQLRNRRSAAITQGGALRALSNWVTRDPENGDLACCSAERQKRNFLSAVYGCLSTLLDYVIPFPYATLHHDVGKENYPVWLCNALREQEEEGTGAVLGEWLVTLGSYFVLFVIAFRTYVN